MDYLLSPVHFVIIFTILVSPSKGNEGNENSFSRPTWRQPITLNQGEIIFEDVPSTMFRHRPDYVTYERPSDSYDEYIPDKDTDPNYPYEQQQGAHAAIRSIKHMPKPHFQSLCPSIRRTVKLGSDDGYIYQPDEYETVTCIYPYSSYTDHHQHKNKVCRQGGNFSCMQLTKKIVLTRKSIGDNCWELESREIPSGCECMWPQHILGDIKDFH